MDMATRLPHRREGRNNTGVDSECTANFRTHSFKMTQEGTEIKLVTLTDMLPLLQATHNPPLDLGTRSLIYDIAPWKGENLLAESNLFSKRTPTILSPRVEIWIVVKRVRYPYHLQPTIPTRNKLFPPKA